MNGSNNNSGNINSENLDNNNSIDYNYNDNYHDNIDGSESNMNDNFDYNNNNNNNYNGENIDYNYNYNYYGNMNENESNMNDNYNYSNNNNNNHHNSENGSICDPFNMDDDDDISDLGEYKFDFDNNYIGNESENEDEFFEGLIDKSSDNWFIADRNEYNYWFNEFNDLMKSFYRKRQYNIDRFNELIGPSLIYNPDEHIHHRDLIHLMDKKLLQQYSEVANKYDMARIKCLRNNGALSWLGVPYNMEFSHMFTDQEMFVLLSLILRLNVRLLLAD